MRLERESVSHDGRCVWLKRKMEGGEREQEYDAYQGVACMYDDSARRTGIGRENQRKKQSSGWPLGLAGLMEQSKSHVGGTAEQLAALFSNDRRRDAHTDSALLSVAMAWHGNERNNMGW